MTMPLEIVTGFCATHLAFFQDVAAGAMTTGRVRSLVGVAIALIGLVIGVIAWRRAKTGNGRIGAAIALVLGLIGLVLSVLHIAASTGFGTGGGRAGAIVSLVLAVCVSFALRFMLNLVAFWLVEIQGIVLLYVLVSGLLGGNLVPVQLFPDWLQAVAYATPFPAMMQSPIDLVTGQAT